MSTTVVAAPIKFKDVRDYHWFSDNVNQLVELGAINGYPDNTFKPTNAISKAEFTKVLVSVLGHENLKSSGSHWASGYIDKAIELKLANKSEMDNPNGIIRRGLMAKMVSNAIEYLGETQVSNREDYINQLFDFNEINDFYKDYVLKAFTKGIITGYPEGTFKSNNSLTRAEASTVIMRIIDKEKRILPAEPVIVKPEDTITKAEFIRDIMTAMGFRNLPPTGPHWASGYVDKAKTDMNAHTFDFNNLDNPITRQDVARLIRGANYRIGNVDNKDLFKYIEMITDSSNQRSLAYGDETLKVVANGIMPLYEDGSFRGYNNISKEDAADAISKLIDVSKRIIPALPEKEYVEPPTESGIDANLRGVPLISNVFIRFYDLGEHLYNQDFFMSMSSYKILDDLLTDAENLLLARFGKENKGVINEIISYLESTKSIKYDTSKEWYVNDQRVLVSILDNSISLTVWYPNI